MQKKMISDSATMSSARAFRRPDWRVSLIAAPLLAATLAANALLGVMVAPQVASLLSHVAPTNHSAVAVTPQDILGGPGVP